MLWILKSKLITLTSYNMNTPPPPKKKKKQQKKQKTNNLCFTNFQGQLDNIVPCTQVKDQNLVHPKSGTTH